MDAQLLGDFGHALAMAGPHPPSDVNLDRLAVTTHRIAPSSPLVEKVVGMERRQLSWQRGEQVAYKQLEFAQQPLNLRVNVFRFF